MMRRWIGVNLVVAAVGTTGAGSARSQVYVGSGPGSLYGVAPYYAAPGNFGTTFGSPSFGIYRGYSGFSSPYGAGYGYGYGPSGFIPGPYGVGLWRAGTATADGYIYGGSYYGTFAAPYRSWTPFNPVPIGIYAPGFGPTYYPSYGR